MCRAVGFFLLPRNRHFVQMWKKLIERKRDRGRHFRIDSAELVNWWILFSSVGQTGLQQQSVVLKSDQSRHPHTKWILWAGQDTQRRPVCHWDSYWDGSLLHFPYNDFEFFFNTLDPMQSFHCLSIKERGRWVIHHTQTFGCSLLKRDELFASSKTMFMAPLLHRVIKTVHSDRKGGRRKSGYFMWQLLWAIFEALILHLYNAAFMAWLRRWLTQVLCYNIQFSSAYLRNPTLRKPRWFKLSKKKTSLLPAHLKGAKINVLIYNLYQ